MHNNVGNTSSFSPERGLGSLGFTPSSAIPEILDGSGGETDFVVQPVDETVSSIDVGAVAGTQVATALGVNRMADVINDNMAEILAILNAHTRVLREHGLIE